MVAIISSGKSIERILRYNGRKVVKGFANLLDEAKFGCDPNGLSFSEKVQRFRMLTRMNKNVKTNAIHISLNFSQADLLGRDRLVQIVRTYMQGIGFGNQPYLLYEHIDTIHPHVHLLTTHVDKDGKQ